MMEEVPSGRRRPISYKELSFIENLIRENSSMEPGRYEGDAPTFAYNEGWSDERIRKTAEEHLKRALSIVQIARFRITQFGAMASRRGGRAVPAPAASARINGRRAFMGTVLNLHQQHALLEQRVEAMEMFLKTLGYASSPIEASTADEGSSQ